MTSEIQWYIARDGKQYGPLSDPEMGLFVQGGHLKAEDLVWRPGFAEWMPASVAFPPAAPPMTAPPAAPRLDPRTQSQPGFAANPMSQQAASRNAQPAQGQNPAAGARLHPGGPAAMARGSTTPGPGGASQAQPQPARGPMAATEPKPDAARTTGRAVVAVESGFPDDEAGGEAPERPSRLRRLAIAAAILAIAGSGLLAYQARDSLKSMLGGSAGRTAKSGLDPSIPAFVVPGGAVDAIDARLQRTALWSVVKREFPDWYGQRLAETAKLTAEKKPDAAVTRHLLEALVALRRQHANDALAASSPRLVMIADAFLANLKRISATSTTTCYSFISQGESSPAIVELIQQQGGDAHLQAQVTAIFEAIAEGRKSPVKYATPDKADYDALAEQLTKLGWSQADLQLFADPRALARTSHDRVCKMVQDWFSAHIAVKDRSAQERLLIETLRPVVAG